MISVDGQFAVRAKLADKDFLTLDNLIDLNLIEYAGTDLPVVELLFKVQDSTLLRHLNEGSILSLSLGQSPKEMHECNFLLQQPKIGKAGTDKWIVKVAGIHAGLQKWASSSVHVSNPISAIERIIQVASDIGFKVDSNIEKSLDTQPWIQYGCTAKQHVDDIWLHADLGVDSFPTLAATFDTFRIRDVKKMLLEDPKWVFKHEAQKDNEISFDADFDIEHLSGFLNSIGARGLDQPFYDMVTGDFDSISSNPKKLMALTKKLNIAKTFTKTSNARQVNSRNTHPNYLASHIHNYTQLALFSSIRVLVQWENLYKPIRPLDLVFFKETDIQQSMGNSVETYSGLYIVNKVVRNIAGSKFKTSVQMVREGTNMNKGDLL